MVPFTLADALLFPGVLVLGAVTSIEDFRIGKVRNVWILRGMLYAVLVYCAVFLLQFVMGGDQGVRALVQPFFYRFDRFLVTVGTSICVAYALWRYRVWGAGDAKLFICYSMLFPLSSYRLVYFDHYFASYLILLAIFIPATVFLLGRSLFFFLRSGEYWRTRAETRKVMPRRPLKEKCVGGARIFLGFFLMFILAQLLIAGIPFFSRGGAGSLGAIVLSWLVFRPLSLFFKRYHLAVISGFLILAVGAGFFPELRASLISKELWFSFLRALAALVGFPVFRMVIDEYVDYSGRKESRFAVWMFLGTIISRFL
jgi:hypothetical protein